MKLIKTLIAASILSLAAVGSASAITVSDVTSSANVRITVENGVATLFGHVDSSFERYQVGQAAKKIDGVDRVRNLLLFSN